MSPGASEKLDREIVIIASVVVVGALMSILDTTIVNVGLATRPSAIYQNPGHKTSTG